MTEFRKRTLFTNISFFKHFSLRFFSPFNQWSPQLKAWDLRKQYSFQYRLHTFLLEKGICKKRKNPRGNTENQISLTIPFSQSPLPTHVHSFRSRVPCCQHRSLLPESLPLFRRSSSSGVEWEFRAIVISKSALMDYLKQVLESRGKNCFFG